MSMQTPNSQEAVLDQKRPDGPRMVKAQDDELAQLRRLEIFSLIEASTLLLLIFIAVPLKHLGGWPLGVQIMGPVHGLAFCAYLWMVIQTVSGANWRWAEVARMIVFAMLPFGGFLNVALLSRKIAALREKING